MNRNNRKQLAEQTLAIIARGGYEGPTDWIDLREQIEMSKRDSKLFTPGGLGEICAADHRINGRTGRISVVNTTTLAVARAMVDPARADEPCVLNFASAKNPGGGFLGGSQAQEESLARSSALYATLLEHPRYYEANRVSSDVMYTDHLIYSPGVPVFRDDDGNLLDRPYTLSFVTMPAVNVGYVRQNAPNRAEEIETVMSRRIHCVLRLAIECGHRRFVLGAWGCGVFRNDPAMIARLFARWLKDERFTSAFDEVVFAVLDRTNDRSVIKPFERELS